MSDNPTPASETERLAEMLCRPCGATPSNQRVAAARLRALQADNERLREELCEAETECQRANSFWTHHAKESEQLRTEREELKAANAALVAEVAKLEGVALDYQKTLCSMGEHNWTDYSEGAYCKACGVIKK